MSAALIINDAICTILAKGPDDGTPTTVGTAVTICLDRVRINRDNTAVDCSCNSSFEPFNRVTKKDWSIDVETKLELEGTLFEKLCGDDEAVVDITITAPGANVEGVGLVKNVTATLDSPSTLTFTVIPYGTGLIVQAEA